MTTNTFEWTDDCGIPHIITSAAPIDAELAALAVKLRELLPVLRSSDAAISLQAFEPVQHLLKRYNQLCADQQRWNQFVTDQNTTAYNARVDAVGELQTKVGQMRLIHQLNATIKDIENRAETGALSAADMFDDVDSETRGLITEAAKIADVPAPVELSHRAAVDWVRTTSVLNREDIPPGAPNFIWLDHQRISHDLRNLTLLECEFMDEVLFLKRCLSKLTPDLLATKSDIAVHLDEGFARIQKFSADFARWDHHIAAIDHRARIELADIIEGGLDDKTN